MGCLPFVPGPSLWEACAEWDLPRLEGHMQTCKFISNGVGPGFLLSVLCPCDPGEPLRRLGENLPLLGSPEPEPHAVIVSPLTC